MTSRSFQPGISALLSKHPTWLDKRNVGLVTHPAAIDTCGMHSLDMLASTKGVNLRAVFGPEHGFFGNAGAGAEIAHTQHPTWKIPVYSLYGSTRKPTEEMLEGIDVIVVDLQDLAARPYTYVSTLKLVMEAASGLCLPVIVADRPVPLPNIVDGPVLQPRFGSFVGAIPAPMAYGMTPGETALWINDTMGLNTDLRIAKMRGYRRDAHRNTQWPSWIPPSPGIKSWESGWLYLSTVFTEALPVLDNGRGTALAFQVLGAPWLEPASLCRRLTTQDLPGVTFYQHAYVSGSGTYKDRLLPGIRICVTDPDKFRPVSTSVHILSAVARIHGKKRLWQSRGRHLAFMDKLYGTNETRHSLVAGQSPSEITASWRSDCTKFQRSRKRHLLYTKSS